MSDESDIGRLGALLGVLKPEGAQPTPREVAELIWLADNLPDGVIGRRIPGSHADGAATVAESPQQPNPDELEPDMPDSAEHDTVPEENVRLYHPDNQTHETRAKLHRASAIRVSGAPPLPRRRALARAMRPLKRQVPSTTRAVVDEDATADRVAEEERWVPVLVPAQDRWLDLVLIIDAYGDGAVLWEPVGRELQSVLQELGAFRNIRTYWLRRHRDGSPALAASTDAHGSLRSPATVSDPTGRTVTLVLTDGVEPAWGTRPLRGVLRQWAKTGPTAVLQMLPEHLWGQTALAPEPGRFRTTEAGSSNARLGYTPYAFGSRAPEADEISVPVLGVEPEWLEPWARAVAGAGSFDGAAVRLRVHDAQDDVIPVRGTPSSAQPASFEGFLAQAQPGVFRLAAYLAAAPLNLAVMRLVQSAMLPDSPPSDLAEIVFSGLLRHVPGGVDGGALQQAYEFLPGVRERLLSTLRRNEADQVIATVSNYIERNAPATAARFTAAVSDPQGPLLLPVGSQHWAEVHDLVRRRQGRRVAPPRGESSSDPHGAPADDSVSQPRSVTAKKPASPPDSEPLSTQPPVPTRGGARRFLVTIGVSRYEDVELPDLPEVAGDIARVRTVFDRMGYRTVLPHLATDPTATTVFGAAETWARDTDLGPTDIVVLYFAGHAVTTKETTHLLAHDSRASPQDAVRNGLTVEKLHRMFGSGLGNLMLILDTCFRPDRAAPAPDLDQPQLWVLATDLAMTSNASGGVFTRAVTEELTDLTDRAQPHPLQLAELASRIQTRMHQKLEQHAGTPRRASSVWSYTTARNEVLPSFFSHVRQPGLADSQHQHQIALWADQSDARLALAAWMRDQPDDPRPWVLAGSPGSGKTTLLTHLYNEATHQNPDQKSRTRDHWLPQGAQPVLLRALRSTATDLWNDLAVQLGIPGNSETQWIAQLAASTQPTVILLDGLDEAPPGEGRRIVERLVRPLMSRTSIRLIISTRPPPLPEAGTEAEVVELKPSFTLGEGAELRLHRQTLTVRERALGSEHPETINSRRSLALALSDLGLHEEAVDLYRRNLAHYGRVLGSEHPDTLSGRNSLALALNRLGEFEEAVDLHRQNLTVRERVLGSDHPSTLTSRNNLALVLNRLGEFQEAVDLHRQTLVVRERVLGSDHPDTLTIRSNLALALDRLGEFEEAVDLHRQTLTVRERVLGSDHPDTLNSRNDLALALFNLGEFEEAVDLYQQTLVVRERVLGSDHIDTLTSRYNLALVLNRLGEHQEAVDLHRQTLVVRERVLGSDHPDTLTSRNNLALELYRLGEHQEAVVLHRQTLVVRERVLGSDHPSTLTSRNNLALALFNLGEFQEAVDLYRQTLVVRERVLGSDHPSTLTSRNNLALVLNRLGEFQEAVDLHRQTLVVRERVLGSDHPDTLTIRSNLALALDRLGEFEEAVDLHRQTLTVRERVLGSDHPDTLNSRNDLALALFNLGEFEEAVDLYQQTLVVRERVLGSDHIDTLTSRYNLALVLNRLGEHQEAVDLHRQTLVVRERVLGSDHPDTLTSRNNLALALSDLGEHQEAVDLHRQTLVVRERVLGSDHPSTLNSRNDLALALFNLGEFQEAVDLYRQTLVVRERVLGSDHPDTLTSRNNLATAEAALAGASSGRRRR
ncbi:tetratricopeptide repeat protein [Streptomyces sp. NPDC005146]